MNTPAAATGNRPSILVVDDTPENLQLMSALLKDLYRVKVANGGERALKIAAGEGAPDLILLDIMMPEMDGYAVCQRLKADPATREIPVIFLTAKSEVADEEKGFALGAVDYITKPIRPKVFVSKIKALLKRSGGERPDGRILESNGIKIDLEKVLVYIGEQELQLPKKEFELLVLLMSKPGKVFKRDEIYSQIWGNELFVGDRTIDVHIRKLREKIGDERIKTIKGIGYKFDA